MNTARAAADGKYYTGEGLPYYVVDGVASWSPPPAGAAEPAAAAASGDDAGGHQSAFLPVAPQPVAAIAAGGVSAFDAPAPEPFVADEAAKSIGALHTMCREFQLRETPSALSKRLLELKDSIVEAASETPKLQSELKELEGLIALYIKHWSEVEQSKTKRHGHGNSTKSPDKYQARLSGEDKVRYETLVYLLRVSPESLSKLIREGKTVQRPQINHLILSVLYADMHDDDDDQLLLYLFGDALAEETARCTDSSTFMRSNTALTDLMTKYSQRDPGKMALKKMLAAPIMALLREAHGHSLELAPVKVYREMLASGSISAAATGPDGEAQVNTPEEAAAIPEVAAETEVRLQRAVEIASKFVHAITSDEAIEEIPYGMRWVAKTILQQASKLFDGSDGGDDAYRLLGGFVFLRYINPAIVSPESLELSGGPVSNQMRKNLVLIAKILQASSNNVLFGQLGKELELTPLNGFLSSNQPRMRAYFDKLVGVEEDLGLREAELDKYLRTLRETSAHRFTQVKLTELHSLHRLLMDHDTVLTHPMALSALRQLPTPPSPPLPKDEDVDVFLRKQAPPELAAELESMANLNSGSLPGVPAGRARTRKHQMSVARRYSRLSVSVRPRAEALPAAAPARAALRAVLTQLPAGNPLLGSPLPTSAAGAWAALLTRLEAEAASAGGAAQGLCAELRGAVSSLPWAESRGWSLVRAASDELLEARYLTRQIIKYEGSLGRLRETADALQKNNGMYQETLEKLREQHALGQGGRELPSKYACSGEKLIHKGLFDASRLPRVDIEGKSAAEAAKIVKAYWPKAAFTFERKGIGIFEVTAIVRYFGAKMTVWEGRVDLEMLLKERAKGSLEVEIEGADISLAPLLMLLDAKFYRKNEKRDK